MGSGIAQVAAQSGHLVVLSDTNDAALEKSKAKLQKVMARLVEKGKITLETAESIQTRISYTTDLTDFAACGLVIEAIVERIDVKRPCSRPWNPLSREIASWLPILLRFPLPLLPRLLKKQSVLLEFTSSIRRH